MAHKRLISYILCVVMLLTMLPYSLVMADSDKKMRSIYLHAQGENPLETTNSSTVYMGDTADIYFAIDNPNKGDYDEETKTHLEPQYDLNGYTLRICYDPDYFKLKETELCPIDYAVPNYNFGTSDTEDEEIGGDTGSDVPQSVGYFVFKQGKGKYTIGEDTYETAYITVFYNGAYIPQKEDGKLWYNLAKLPLIPKRTGSTSVFIDLDTDNEGYVLELFAKNKSDELEEQTFDYNVINGGVHHILIKEGFKPAPPVADHASGNYVDNIEVELTQKNNLPIYYTIDGSNPTSSSTRIEYKGPIYIDVTTEVRTCAYRASDGKYSNVVSYVYNIIPERPYLFDEEKDLLPDVYRQSSEYDVYVSDNPVFGTIDDSSDVYYTFSTTIDEKKPEFGNDPETQWVKIEKATPYFNIDRKRTVRLFTDKMGNYSEVAWYYLSIKPDIVVADHESGIYDKKIDVALSCATKKAIIYYTIDGTDPKTSVTRSEYDGVPISVSTNTTIRAISYFDGEWSDKNSYYYIFDYYDDYGVSAFYPSGIYEGDVKVTIIPNNPDRDVMYHTGDGQWKVFTDTLIIDEDTDIIAKAVELDPSGAILSEGEEHTFIYKIKPLPPLFVPESTQFANAGKTTIYTPESREETTDRYELYYTLDGTNPVTSATRIKADDESDSAVINITNYTIISAVVLKDGETYSDVVTNTYSVNTSKPAKPVPTLTPGYYTVEIGGEKYKTQFMPVPDGTQIYYTICGDGGLCPDPVPSLDGTYMYDGTSFIDIKGNTVIKAVAVNIFGVKSDLGTFSYYITPEAPVAAPSATIKGTRFPVVPVDAVKGSTVKYLVCGFENEFDNEEDERFYIDTQIGNAYRDAECTIPLGNQNSTENQGESVTLEILSVLDGVESDTNKYIYILTDDENTLVPPYADKASGTYEERKIDDDNNLLAIKLYSLNSGGEIQYRTETDENWLSYTSDSELLIKEYTLLYLRYAKDGKYSDVVSYVYDFVPLAPIIRLPSGIYNEDDKETTRISYDDGIPTDKRYSIWYRRNTDTKDRRYNFADIAVSQTMSVKAYVLNEDSGRVSKNTIHYYIVESDDVSYGNVYIAYPYDRSRIAAHLLTTGDYAEGIKLLSQNKEADIYYYYSYTRLDSGEEVTTNEAVFDITHPIIPTSFMDDITIVAWLEDEYDVIQDSHRVFYIDFVHLNVPVTSLEISGKTEFPYGTKYTLINEYEYDKNISLYYTLDGSDPTNPENDGRMLYAGEELELTKTTTVRAVYLSSCGKCVECQLGNLANCWDEIYGKIGTYKYTIAISGGSGGGGSIGVGGSGGASIDKSRKYTIDIFGYEHPTHIGYIYGYPDGSVQPEGMITREEIAAILYRTTNHQYNKPFTSTGEVFSDVELGRWSVTEIEYMADSKVIFGYPDGEFKPRRNLSRAEFAALICRLIGVEKKDNKNIFTDLDETHWAYKEILALADMGLLKGYEDSTFRPQNFITRAEVMTVMNIILGRKPLDSYVKSLVFNPYTDLYEDKWYYVTVLEATITHNYWLDNKGYEYKWEDCK